MKYKIMQQVAMYNGLGGPSKALQRLMNSDELKQFEMKILEQTAPTKGNFIKVIKKYLVELKKERPDLVHIRGVQTEALACLIACKIAKVPHTVMSVNGMASDLYAISQKKKIIFQYIIEPLCFHLVDKAFTVYKGGLARKKILRFKKKLCGYIYNPLPNWNYNLISSLRENVRKKYGIYDKEIVALCVSRISYEKGFSYVIEAIRHLQIEWPNNLKIMIVGKGEYENYLKESLKKELKENKVILVPGTTDVQQFYYAADVFFTASLHENHSNAILEACAAHIPVIATNVGGNGESIEDGIGGWLIRPKNFGDLLESFKKISKLPEDELKKMGDAAYENAYKLFHMKKIYKKLAELYVSVIENN